MLETKTLTTPEKVMLELMLELAEKYWSEFTGRFEEYTETDFPDQTFEKMKQEITSVN